MPTDVNAEIAAVARFILITCSDQKIVLGVPQTEYQLHLVPTVPAAQISTPLGKRIKGTIHARALRMFKTEVGGGGRFIEPIIGEPRIVAGAVLAVDNLETRVLVDVTIPMWMSLVKDQAASMFARGDLVNCYVESGVRFTPA